MRDYIDVQYGICGYFAVYMSWDEECGCHMPWQTGIGHYKTREEAEAEARAWAEAEGLNEEESYDMDIDAMIRAEPGHAIPGYNTPLF